MMKLSRLSIRTRLLAGIGALFLSLLLVAAKGWRASGTANQGLQTVFNDRVVPLRDLKIVADMYAVNMVDTSHKVRNGNLPWSKGPPAVEEASARIKERWQAYMGTYMEGKEKKLADEVGRNTAAAGAAAAELLAILHRQDQAALDVFVKERL
jgi:methyl-accepting chemotaxis protein